MSERLTREQVTKLSEYHSGDAYLLATECLALMDDNDRLRAQVSIAEGALRDVLNVHNLGAPAPCPAGEFAAGALDDIAALAVPEEETK